jgi:cytochrome c2
MQRAGQSGLVSNTRTLSAFLADPRSDIPSDKMPFSGIANQTERQAVIAYLARATR